MLLQWMGRNTKVNGVLILQLLPLGLYFYVPIIFWATKKVIEGKI